MKRMLFNATQSEEIRVAIINNSTIEDLDYERSTREQRKSNIYKGTITRVEPSLEAAFVNYGVDRHGFLPFKEIAKEFYSKKSRKKNLSIADVINEGQEVIVQVSKEERGNKGAALTTFLSLAGRYIVLMPNSSDSGGISRRIEGDERLNFKEVLSQLKVKKGMSVIGRTAGIGVNVEEIQWDLDYLTQLSEAIQEASGQQEGPFLIYQESNLVIRAIRDYFNTDIEEILIDNQDIYDQASQFMNHVMPDYADRIQLYEESTALFSKFNIENQIESAFLREVQLPSGGVIVIDHTEALVSIDVNSSRSTKGRDIENTAFNTNLEAAKEVAKQLRLRDIGGLIVVDFIDMENPKHQREVEECLRDALKHDKARIQIGRISRFGLMELSRQRLRPSIGETSNGECPKCNGTGRIRDFQSSALHVIRMIQEQSNKKQGQKISVQVPVDVATFLLNEKREIIIQTESEGNNKIFIIANKYFDVPQFKITSSDLGNKKELSYQEVDIPDVENLDDNDHETKDKQIPAVKGVMPEKRSRKSKNKSLFGFIKGLIASDDTTEESSETASDSNKEPSKDLEESEGNKKPYRNNRRRRNNRSRNYRSNQQNQENVNKKPEMVMVETPIDVEKNSDKNSDSVNKPKVKPKGNQSKKKAEELKDVNLADVGLKLVETEKKSNQDAPLDGQVKKPARRKKASWAKSEKTAPKKTEKLVMVETKDAPKKSTKTAKAKTSAPKKSTKKTAEK
ncbi:ribonuclease E [Methylophilales bacterium MBRSG12]|uniref:Ribonuclease G n=1 Tax=Methylophilales bacterium MBRS-H7 TaxID=1623450 RepID=A0A0H4JD11_9PROT|nr:ribonuclease E [Methylophilales bacterium MBRSF5]AKO66372.1 ribonuclease E [Methylophilales bacterium MBRS-H7]AKO67687.1 ribonuclease E [Methylophilales bacterium MBRSG12]